MTNYKTDLLADLLDPEYAAMYLNDALASGSPEEFLIALRDVAESRTMSTVAESAQLNRVSMYRMLSGSGNPRLSSLIGLLSALDLRIKLESTLPQSAKPLNGGQPFKHVSSPKKQAKRKSGIPAPPRPGAQRPGT
jgi:probable addiction module antidote protein